MTNNNDNTMTMSLLHSHCPTEFTWFRPGQPTWVLSRAVSPPVGCYHPPPLSLFIKITSLESYSAQKVILTEGRRLSWARQCSKGVQPVYTAVLTETNTAANSGIRSWGLSHCIQYIRPTWSLSPAK